MLVLRGLFVLAVVLENEGLYVLIARTTTGRPGCGICYGRPQRSSTLALPPLLPFLVLLPLTLGTPSAAQPQPPARERQERQVVVPNSPEEPVPEVRVAAHVATYLRFDAPIDRASVEVEGRATRFRVVDPGERTLTLEPTLEPGPGEKLGVRVRYRDGVSPAAATFALVSHPTVVDKEVEVVRRPRTLEALETALAESQAELTTLKSRCGVSGHAGLVFSGQLDVEGVRARRLEDDSTSPQNGLEYAGGAAYRAAHWVLAVVRVRNLPGQPPWVLGTALLTRADGTPVKGLSMAMDRAQLAPGEEGLVAVETEARFWNAEDVLRLELADKSGHRHLSIPNVKH